MSEPIDFPGRRAVMRQHSLRSANLSLAMNAITALDAPSRADIAALTGMTRSTVSRLVDELVAGGLVTEMEPISGHRGRPATPLIPARHTICAIGCELGVKHVTVRVCDLAGQILSHRYERHDLVRLGPTGAMRVVARLMREVMDEMPGAEFVGAGLAVPGLISVEGDLILAAPNLRWEGIDPADLLASVGFPIDLVPLTLLNEAKAAVLTISRAAPGRNSGRDSFFYLSGESGIGSAFVRRGEVVPGHHGWAGELGHVCIDPAGALCDCGATGCLETVAGLDAMLRATGAHDLQEIVAMIATGDERAIEVVRRAGEVLGVVIAGTLNVLDLEAVVIGGYLADFADEVLPAVQEQVAKRVLSHRLMSIEVSVAPGREWRAANGAAFHVLSTLVDDPAEWLDSSRRAASSRQPQVIKAG